MIISTYQALAVALLAIVPGYITIYFWSRNKLWRGLTNDLQTVLKALALSAVLQVMLAPYTLSGLYPVRNTLDQHPWRVLMWSALLVLGLPYLLGTVGREISNWFETVREPIEPGRLARLISLLLGDTPPP